MERIKEIKKRNNDGIEGDIYEYIVQCRSDIEYLLAENKRLREYHERIDKHGIAVEEATKEELIEFIGEIKSFAFEALKQE